MMGLFALLLKDPETGPKVAALLDFTVEEIALLLGTKPTTKKVLKIREAAERILEEERVSEIEGAWGGAKKPEKAEKRERRRPDRAKRDAVGEGEFGAGSKAADLDEEPVEEDVPEKARSSADKGEGTEAAESGKDDRRQRSLFDF